MVFKNLLRLTSFICVLSAIMMGSGLAVPPSPDAIEKWKAEGVLEEKLDQWKKIDHPHEHPIIKEPLKLSADITADAPETLRVVVLLVDFDDNPHRASITANSFDSVLFSEGIMENGSMTDFFLENSYGKVLVTGEVHGWYRASQPYSYYVGENNGDFAGQLAAEVVNLSDPDINYRDYTGGVPGVFNGLVVIHAGAGAETGAYGIWSHQSSLPGTVMPDSVVLANYTMQPEITGSGGPISTIGVFCHEYGHMLGLPDYYDVVNTSGLSEGLGSWSLMAGGSWNGSSGDLPSHFDAYSKIWLGYVDPIYVFDTSAVPAIVQAEIPQVESEPVIYKIKNETASFTEYWLVENRQHVGSDRGLPGTGLAIYHVDVAVGGNTNPDRYRVAIEEADNNGSLPYLGIRGQAGDLWPGTSDNRNFHDITSPDTKYNLGATSQVGVWNISDSDSLMYADLESYFTHPWLVLTAEDSITFSDAAPGGNGNGIMEAGETIEFECKISNTMAQSFYPQATLTCDHPGVVFTNQSSTMGISLNPAWEFTELSEPITFTVPVDLVPANVVFTLTIESDADLVDGPAGDYSTTFELEAVLGWPDVLLVDDDNVAGALPSYKASIGNVGLAYNTWNKSGGSPTAADLLIYDNVVWHTGDPVSGGSINADDITAIKGFLDGGGNLLLSSIKGAQTIAAIDSAFLADYLFCNYVNASFGLGMNGVAGNPISEGTSYQYDVPFQSVHDNISVLAPAEVCFTGNPSGTNGLSYDGEDYKLVFLTFPIEFFGDNVTGKQPKDTLFARVFDFFEATPLGIDDEIPENLPGQFVLGQNYPNPFNPATQISYTLPADGNGAVRANLVVYNVLGQQVRTLVDKVQAPGTYTVEWDGKDYRGEKVSSGIYLYRLSHGQLSETRKMILLK